MYYKNKKLTEQQKYFHEEKRCIFCGVKMPVQKYYKEVDGKHILDKETCAFECYACIKQTQQQYSGVYLRDYGPSRASLHHEFRRIIKSKRTGPGAKGE